MKPGVFLTVMAVLDPKTQEIMSRWQQKLFDAGMTGTQTMGIPFHVSLGSYPEDQEEALSLRVREIAGQTQPFPLVFQTFSTFSSRVLFARPEESKALQALHAPFDCNYADGFPWTPHCTLFCGQEDEVRRALSLLDGASFPLSARVTAIELGMFFPHRFICRHELGK